MDENQVSFRAKLLAFIICAVVFAMFYNFAAWYTSTLHFVPSFVFNFEKHIPFLPWTIIPYLTSSIGFCLVFFMSDTKRSLLVLSKRMLFVSIFAGVFFMLFPLKFSLQKPTSDNFIFEYLFEFLQNIDSPFNQSPSLHVTFALVFWTVFRNLKSHWRRVSAFWLILMALSTLTTFQHHFADVLSGGILAQLSFVLFPAEAKDFKYRNFLVANYYFLVGWIVALISLVLSHFFNYFWLGLLWIAMVLFSVGYQYQKNNVNFLKNKSGNISLIKKIFYFPYLLLYWFFWKFLRKNKVPSDIIPGLFLSSKLSDSEAEQFIAGQKTFVYDLSAELAESDLIKDNTQYYFFPFLDIGTYDEEKTKFLVQKIADNYHELSEEGKILIHCTMGFTRSTILCILVVKKILSLPLDKAILKVKAANKNAVIHENLLDFLNKLKI